MCAKKGHCKEWRARAGVTEDITHSHDTEHWSKGLINPTKDPKQCTNGGDRTRDHTVKSRALYLLSYVGYSGRGRQIR